MYDLWMEPPPRKPRTSEGHCTIRGSKSTGYTAAQKIRDEIPMERDCFVRNKHGDSLHMRSGEPCASERRVGEDTLKCHCTISLYH